jgi:AcrR family transcriptional regulator
VDTTPRPRSTRDRPAKPPLSEDLIVETALEIVRREGLEAVTMRRVATELDTGPASLYVYVRGRDELRQAMLDRVAGAITIEAPDPDHWREQVHRLVRGMLAALEAHPGIARLAVANVPTGENSLRVAESLLGLLLAGGIDAQDAAWACDILPLITTASAVETATYVERGEIDMQAAENQLVEQLTAVFAGLSPARFPNLTSLIGELTSGDGDQRFDFAIETFLDGLVARSERRRRRPAGS